MITREITVSLRSLFTTDEQTRGWMASARTPETRARIRRWSKVETVGMTTILVGIALIVLASFASIPVAVWSSATDNNRPDPYWWIWGVAIGVTACGTVADLIATRRREEACFADGWVIVGTLDRAIEHPGSGEDKTWYDLRISAELPNGATLRRRLHVEGEGFERHVGDRMRFLHNTLDPEEVDDVRFAGWSDRKKRRSRRGKDRG